MRSSWGWRRIRPQDHTTRQGAFSGCGAIAVRSVLTQAPPSTEQRETRHCGRVGSLQLAEQEDARPRPGAQGAVSTHGGKRQTQADLPRTACRRHAGIRWRGVIVACRQGRELSGRRGTEGIQVPSDKEAGRQNKLQSLPLTRIAGRDSPQAPLHGGFIRPQTGKIAAQDQPTNQNLPPGLARECLGSACSCLTSQPLLPAPGRFAEQIRTIAQPPARYGVIPSAPLRACESRPGCGGLRVPRGSDDFSSSPRRELRGTTWFCLIWRVQCVFSMATGRPSRPRWATRGADSTTEKGHVQHNRTIPLAHSVR